MRLIDMVDDKVREHLQIAHALSSQLAVEITTGAKERATYDLGRADGKVGRRQGLCHASE